MKVSSITLNYVCDTDGETATQPLADIVWVGTLICPECGDDMALTDTVTVTPEVEGFIHVVNLDADWWVDGHFIMAPDEATARAEVERLYAPYIPRTVRPWTREDQAELDRQSLDNW